MAPCACWLRLKHSTVLVCCSAFVIATTTELVNTHNDAGQLVDQFYVLQYASHLEPVHGFLGRYLRRRLLAQSHVLTTTAAGSCPVSSDLTRVVDWLPRVWQKVNKFLNVLSPRQLDITIGDWQQLHVSNSSVQCTWLSQLCHVTETVS